MVFVGVDACRKGWVAVVYEPGRSPRGLVAASLADLAGELPEAEGFGVDIPLGLPSGGRRRADEEARRLLGPRANSVFFTPPRSALLAPSHREATELSRAATGYGVSQQAYALRRKVLEAERWVSSAPVPVWEVHPEVSFTVMMEHPATAPKKTWAGMHERLEALRHAGMDLDGLGRAGELAAVDDVLDAAAAAWSAHRLGQGRGICLPDPPDRDPETGRLVAIWA